MTTALNFQNTQYQDFRVLDHNTGVKNVSRLGSQRVNSFQKYSAHGSPVHRFHAILLPPSEKEYRTITGVRRGASEREVRPEVRMGEVIGIYLLQLWGEKRNT